MNIVVLGNKRSGKTSIIKKIFHKISSTETQFLETTTKIQEFPVNNNNFTKCTFFDFPGNFEISQMSSSEHKHLESANIMIYVLDSKDEPYFKTIEKFLCIQSEIYEMNPFCIFEFLIHKIDGEMFSEELSKNAILSEITEYIKPCSQERSLPLADFHLTSIMDYSIYLCISRILQKGSPILLCLPEALDVFISLSMIEKVYIIDVVSKLCMATDSRPVDFISYELCCEALDVSLELSTIYGLSGDRFEEAFNENSVSVISCDNGYNVYLRHFDHLLAAVCILKDATFEKKEIVNINMKALQSTFEKISKSCEKIMYCVEDKKKTCRIVIMDNHDVVVLDDFHKREGSRPEYFTPKQDRLLHSDHQNFHSPIQSFLKRNSPDPNKCLIDKRLRVLTQSRTDLAADTKSLSAKKSSDSRDVERINISKVPFLPLLSIRTSLLEELYIEIKELKVNISELEEKIKVNSHCIDTGKIKLRDLQERHSKLKKRVGLGQTVDEKREELKNRLKTIHTKWVKNSLKLKSKISELENEAKILNTRGDSLKSKIFQRSEEHQQLRRNIQKSESSTESGYHSCDHLNSSGQLKSVKYTPSYNSLSIT